MIKKRKDKKRNSDYKPVFTDAEHKLMLNYRVGNLVDEVGVNRIMIMRTLDKMNQEMENLSFRDHLDAMRAFAYTTGRIASLLDTRERLNQPYKEIEERYNRTLNKIAQATENFANSVMSKKAWKEYQDGAFRRALERENSRR